MGRDDIARGARILVAVVALAGCSVDAGARSDTGMDADVDAAMPPAPFLCGPEPRVHVTGHITSYTDMTRGLRGVHLTTDLCPELELVTDAHGDVAGDLARGMPYNPRIVAAGYVTARTGEQILLGDFDLSAFVFPSALTSVLPNWGTDRPTLLAATFGGAPAATDGGGLDAGPPAPCTSVEGSTFTVVGHPEAVITYFSGTTIPVADPTLTATGPIGAAEISGLNATAPGEYVTLTVENAACPAISFVSYPHTGRYRLENGTLTLAAAFLAPLAAP